MADKKIPDRACSKEGQEAWMRFAAAALASSSPALSREYKIKEAVKIADELLLEWVDRWTKSDGLWQKE